MYLCGLLGLPAREHKVVLNDRRTTIKNIDNNRGYKK